MFQLFQLCASVCVCPFLHVLSCAAGVQAHCHYMVLKMFRDKVEQVEDPGVHAVLATLARLYAIHGIGDHMGDFLQVCLLSASLTW